MYICIYVYRKPCLADLQAQNPQRNCDAEHCKIKIKDYVKMWQMLRSEIRVFLSAAASRPDFNIASRVKQCEGEGWWRMSCAYPWEDCSRHLDI